MQQVRFLSTPSARRATSQLCRPAPADRISIHALREEGDSPPGCCCKAEGDFYPRPPRGGRPGSFTTAPRKPTFLSTPSARRATFDIAMYHSGVRFLSTPSARRATAVLAERLNHGCISIHALREEGDVDSVIIIYRSVIFLSTPSARRATFAGPLGAVVLCISIHALREEGDSGTFTRTATAGSDFYPRPPRGGRPLDHVALSEDCLFLSTPSARRATF